MKLNPPKIFYLKDTPASQDYHGSGWSVLVTRYGAPQKLIYLPATEGMALDDVLAAVDFSNVRVRPEAKDTDVEAFLGMASCWEFCAMKDLLIKELD